MKKIIKFLFPKTYQAILNEGVGEYLRAKDLDYLNVKAQKFGFSSIEEMEKAELDSLSEADYWDGDDSHSE